MTTTARAAPVRPVELEARDLERASATQTALLEGGAAQRWAVRLAAGSSAVQPGELVLVDVAGTIHVRRPLRAEVGREARVKARGVAVTVRGVGCLIDGLPEVAVSADCEAHLTAIPDGWISSGCGSSSSGGGFNYFPGGWP